jgi:hypothetical protein
MGGRRMKTKKESDLEEIKEVLDEVKQGDTSNYFSCLIQRYLMNYHEHDDSYFKLCEMRSEYVDIVAKKHIDSLKKPKPLFSCYDLDKEVTLGETDEI